MTDTVAINALIDIRTLAEQAGARFRGNSSHCPVHGGDNPTAFSIFDNGRAWKCFTHPDECNAGGHDGIALVMALNGWTFREVCERYAPGQPLDPQEAARRAAENAERVERELKESIERARRALRELQEGRRWLEYHDSMSADARELWRARGVQDEWQDFYKLGYNPSFSYAHGADYYKSPTLTIPTFDIDQTTPNNLKHRLLRPAEPKDKYRYEMTGIPAHPFYGDRFLPLDCANRILIVEGEINGAVTFAELDPGSVLYQVIGMPSKNQRRRLWPELAERLRGQSVWIAPDPDAASDGLEFAKMIGHARMIYLPAKMDDMIKAGTLNRAKIHSLMDKAIVIK